MFPNTDMSKAGLGYAMLRTKELGLDKNINWFLGDLELLPESPPSPFEGGFDLITGKDHASHSSKKKKKIKKKQIKNKKELKKKKERKKKEKKRKKKERERTKKSNGENDEKYE